MKRILMVTCVLLAFSCSRRKAEANLPGISVKVIEAKRQNGLQEYNVRLSFDAKKQETDNALQTQKMYFKMDSCFYKEQESIKQYAVSVIPIANGLKHTFDYVVSFDDSGDTGNEELYFDNKWIGEPRVYRLSLK